MGNITKTQAKFRHTLVAVVALALVGAASSACVAAPVVPPPTQSSASPLNPSPQVEPTDDQTTVVVVGGGDGQTWTAQVEPGDGQSPSVILVGEGNDPAVTVTVEFNDGTGTTTVSDDPDLRAIINSYPDAWVKDGNTVTCNSLANPGTSTVLTWMKINGSLSSLTAVKTTADYSTLTFSISDLPGSDAVKQAKDEAAKTLCK